MKPEFIENKLYTARDIEGEPNFKELEMIRQLEDRLNKNESFVGIAPFGSMVSGYSTAESDIDIFVLYDDPGITKIDNLEEQAELWEREIKRSGIDADILFQNINLKLILQDLRVGIKLGRPHEFISPALTQLSRVVTGKRIEHYRRIVSAELQKLTSEQKEKVIDVIVERLVRRDELSLYKRKKRMPELSEEDHQRILEARATKWRKRVQKVWSLEDS